MEGDETQARWCHKHSGLKMYPCSCLLLSNCMSWLNSGIVY